MHSRLISWSRMVYLAGIVLALVLVVPTAWFPFQLGKVAIWSLFAVVAVVLFVIGRGDKELLKTHGLKLGLLVGLIPLVYLLSAFMSSDQALSFTGFNIETDTFLFVVLAFVAFILSFTLFRTLRTVRTLLTVVFWALVAAVIFQWISIVFGSTLIPFQTFADRSVNLVGKWNDLGLLAGLLSMILLGWAEFSSTTPLRKGLMVGGGVAIAILLGVINFPLAWGLVLTFAIALAILKFLTQRMDTASEPATQFASHPSWSRKLPWFAIGTAVVSLAFLFFGGAFNTTITNVFPVSSLEVRPSYTSTMNVISAARGGSFERLLFGTGPNTFSQSWIANKPSEVNQTPFWNLDFNVGFSSFVTALGTVGLLGVAVWLIPFVLVLMSLVRAVRLGVLSREERITATALGVGSLFLLAAILLYVPSQNIVLLAFTLSGAAFGFLWRQGRPGAQAAEEQQVAAGRGLQIAASCAVVVILVATVRGGFVVEKRFIAEAITGAGAISLQNGNADDALSAATKAQGVEKNADDMRLAIDSGDLKLQQIASSNSASTQNAQTQFAAVLQQTINTGKDAITRYPQDYRLYLSLGRVYDFLTTLKIQGAYDSAKSSYDQAAKINPTDPEIPLALARLEAGQNKIQSTQTYLTQALTLKPNYTDAILLVVQLDVANNDIPNAIRAATAAAQTAPGVGPIWFELGLLYYAAGDTKDAIAPFEQAISIVPDYANAKYFLGLSYYAQNRSSDAIKQFEDLQKSNPDNSEVNLVLSNMRAGNQPFTSAAPALTNPAQRSTAPVSE